MPWKGYAWNNSWIVVNNYSNINDFSTHLFGHAGIFVEPYLWIFGGYDLNNVFNHLLRYSFTSNHWFHVQTENLPSPRYFHTVRHTKFCLVFDKKLIVNKIIFSLKPVLRLNSKTVVVAY